MYDMSRIGALVSALMFKDNKTKLETDIVETWNELYKEPFEEKQGMGGAAQWQIN